MISDTLSDAVREIDDYLKNPATSLAYKGQVRKDILVLRNQMDAMRKALDGLIYKSIYKEVK